MKDYKNIDDKYLFNTYKRFDALLDSGKNATAFTEDGKQLIDFGSGIGVNSLGYCDKDWVEAVSKQAAKLQHTCNLYYNSPSLKLGEMLCNATGMKKVFFANSGAEAIEGSIKIARKYSFDKYGADRNVIVTLKNSFHGRTMTALSATGQDVFHNFFFPFDSAIKHIPANDIVIADEQLQGNVCAVLMELVQGEGGVCALDYEFVESVSKIARERDILLIIDEVQTGIGRTGKLLACENYNIVPDIIALAKGLGGGLPIGAILGGEKVAQTLSYGNHGTTFGGNPVVCAGGLTVMEKLSNPKFLENVNATAEYFRSRLTSCAQVEDISGLGLMLGLKLKSKNAGVVAEECLKNGLLVLTAKDKIRLLPPLTISRDEAERGLNILISVLEKESEL